MNFMKYALVAVIVLALGAVGYGAYDKYLKPREVSVTDLKNAPESYIGRVLITGKVGKVYPEKSVFEMLDEKACCSIYVVVPSTPELQKEFDAPALYKGSLPKEGQILNVKGEVIKKNEGYSLEVHKVTSKGTTLIERV